MCLIHKILCPCRMIDSEYYILCLKDFIIKNGMPYPTYYTDFSFEFDDTAEISGKKFFRATESNTTQEISVEVRTIVDREDNNNFFFKPYCGSIRFFSELGYHSKLIEYNREFYLSGYWYNPDNFMQSPTGIYTFPVLVLIDDIQMASSVDVVSKTFYLPAEKDSIDFESFNIKHIEHSINHIWKV